MIKAIVLYPNEEGKRFDVDYYCNKHIPMAMEKFGDKCKGCTVDQGVAGGEPGAPAPYIVIASLIYESMETFAAAMAEAGEDLAADLPNYTDIVPTMQICEVKM